MATKTVKAAKGTKGSSGSKGKSASSANDKAPVPAVPFEQVVKKNKKLAEQLEGACEEYRAAQDIIDFQLALQANLIIDIEGLAKKLGVEKVAAETWLMMRATGTSSYLNPTKLVELGVSTKVIEKATVRKPWEKYQVRARKTEES